MRVADRARSRRYGDAAIDVAQSRGMDPDLRSPIFPRWVGPAMFGLAALTAVWIAVAFVTYQIAIWIHPARTADGLHPVMPLGQALLAMLVATLAVVILVVVLVTLRSRRRRAAPPDASPPQGP